jgi:hypothetical protein
VHYRGGGAHAGIVKGADHGERVECGPITGSGSKAPVGSRGRALGGDRKRSPLKLKSFCLFPIQRENSPNF